MRRAGIRVETQSESFPEHWSEDTIRVIFRVIALALPDLVEGAADEELGVGALKEQQVEEHVVAAGERGEA
jgi:hypothetical protein